MKFAQFSQALSTEVAKRAGEITEDINTLYIGGGTPSVLPLSVFESLLQTLQEHGHGGPFEEFTVEVNPEDIVQKGEAYVEGLLRLGVNRVSMGVQSFDDSILKWMNRRHSASTALKAYQIIEDAGVDNISIDLIFGLSQMSDSQWKDTLDKALEISSRGVLPRHISSYQLSVEPGSMLAKLVAKGAWSEASDELCERQYGILCDVLASAGYNHYEISNFAQSGYEAKHNSAYWRHVPYVGFGPGAHSCSMDGTSGKRMWNAESLELYLKAGESRDFSAIQDGELLDDSQLVMEKVMLGLRTSSGVSEEFLRANCSAYAVDEALGGGNLVRISGNRVRIPENRFFISDNIISEIV